MEDDMTGNKTIYITLISGSIKIDKRIIVSDNLTTRKYDKFSETYVESDKSNFEDISALIDIFEHYINKLTKNE